MEYHRIHHQKQSRLFKQEVFNQTRSLSPIHTRQGLQRKSIYSSSYTSLNSYLKEFNLSEKDFLDLRKALQTIFHYLQPQIISDEKYLIKQRLTSPYFQQRLQNDDQQSLVPLYTNEYFIRNGLLNHNDGPEIYDHIFPSRNLCYSNHSKPHFHFKSCSPSFSSSINTSSPLALLSNQKYLLTALTSNFASEKSRRSRSSMELPIFKYHKKCDDADETETESMVIRRNKVRSWERENNLQQKMSVTSCTIQQEDKIDASDYYRSSTVRTASTSKDEKTMKLNEESIAQNSTSLQTLNEEETYGKLVEIKNIDDLFPMVKRLAPYIIIRDSFHQNLNKNPSNCVRSMDIDSINSEKSVQHINYLATASEKRSSTDLLHPALLTAKRRSLWLPSSSPMNPIPQTNNKEQVHQSKKNYLLAEFESVLTEISKN